MKKQILILLLSILPLAVYAEGHVHLEHAPIDTSDMASVQRGAKHFVDYCFSCHSAKYMRFNRIGRDTGMSDAELRENLIFTTNAKGAPTKLGALMTVAMTDDYAKQAFGAAVPDLTLEARARGVDWVYTYLKSFYVDPTSSDRHEQHGVPGCRDAGCGGIVAGRTESGVQDRRTSGDAGRDYRPS